MGKSKKGPHVPDIPQMPTAADVPDQRDEVTGTETVTITDANGKKTRVTRMLPRSAEEQALYDKSQQLIQATLGNIERLAVIDPMQAEEFRPFIASYENLLNTDLNKATAKARQAVETDLAHMGLSNSTAAAEMRAAMSGNEAEARTGIKDKARLMAQDMREQAINHQLTLNQVAGGVYGTDLQKRLSGRTADLSQNENALMQGWHRNNIQSSLGVAQLRQAAYAARGPSSRDQFLQFGATLGGRILGGPIGAQAANQAFKPKGT